MPNFMPILLSALMAAMPTGAAHVPADVTSVESGGQWSSHGINGSYRVIVVNGGFEHVISHVFIEWISDPTISAPQPAVIASVEPALPFGQGDASLEARLEP